MDIIINLIRTSEKLAEERRKKLLEMLGLKADAEYIQRETKDQQTKKDLTYLIKKIDEILKKNAEEV